MKHKESRTTDTEVVLQAGTHKVQKQPPLVGLQQAISTIFNGTACRKN